MICFISLAILICLFTTQAQLTTQDGLRVLNKTLELTFTAQKNQTGHYVTKWLVNKESPEIPTKMKVNLKSSITVFGGIQSFQIRALIAVPPPLPGDYELFPGIGYYKFYAKGVNSYFEASAQCTKDGAHLAIVNSEAEYLVLKSIYARHPAVQEFAYMGFNDFEEDGKYVTIFGDPLDTTGFTTWKPGEPNNAGGNEDCGAIHRTLGLNDLYCDTRGPWPFFCEYDLSWSEI